jgi:hypothetical protein
MKKSLSGICFVLVLVLAGCSRPAEIIRDRQGGWLSENKSKLTYKDQLICNALTSIDFNHPVDKVLKSGNPATIAWLERIIVEARLGFNAPDHNEDFLKFLAERFALKCNISKWAKDEWYEKAKIYILLKRTSYERNDF